MQILKKSVQGREFVATERKLKNFWEDEELDLKFKRKQKLETNECRIEADRLNGSFNFFLLIYFITCRNY